MNKPVELQEQGSLAEQAYQRLKFDIITCALAPGEQIAQPQLVERYQLGVTPVREALQRLVQEGFVAALPRFGYIVAPRTLSDVREIFELREILEKAIVQLAIARAEQSQLDQLAAYADFTYIYHDKPSYVEFLNRNEQFHLAIAEMAGNQRLVEMLSKVLGELTRVCHLGLDLRDSTQEMREEHVSLTQALCVRDTQAALHMVESQISRSKQRIMEALLDGASLGKAGEIEHALRIETRKP